jgi:hypothetical protein
MQKPKLRHRETSQPRGVAVNASKIITYHHMIFQRSNQIFQFAMYNHSIREFATRAVAPGSRDCTLQTFDLMMPLYRWIVTQILKFSRSDTNHELIKHIQNHGQSFVSFDFLRRRITYSQCQHLSVK